LRHAAHRSTRIKRKPRPIILGVRP
jgi:hypothetical protein